MASDASSHQLPKPRARSLGVRCAALALAQSAAAVAYASGFVAIDSVGYRSDQAKVATVVSDHPLEGGFVIKSLGDGSVAYRGELKTFSASNRSDKHYATADFSDVTKAGDYQLVTGDGVESPRFAVGPNPYQDAFRLVFQAMRLWRCGQAVSVTHNGQTFSHEACHLHDGLEPGEPPTQRDGVGGWHDAGDYNKYVTNAGVSVGCLLRAWSDFQPEIEQALGDGSGSVPSFLDEVRWEVDWLLKMQNADGSVAQKLATIHYGPFVMPEDESDPRYFSDWATEAVASFVAMTAATARAIEPYDAAYAEKVLAAARRSHEFLRSHPEQKRADHGEFQTNFYESDDRDDRLWALAELWEATGDPTILEEFETLLRAFVERVDSNERPRRGRRPQRLVAIRWDWHSVANLGVLTYLDSERPGRDPALVARLEKDLLASADEIVEVAARHPFARPLGDDYYWGTNGGVARVTPVLVAAQRRRPDPGRVGAAASAVHHLLGCNPFGRSYVTGLGHQPPMNPHDRLSGSDGIEQPWPGYLVGGPRQHALDWHDVQDDYRTNEIAINWNTALVYALASQLQDAGPGAP